MREQSDVRFEADAVLFDMDGVLTLNSRFHTLAWQRFAREFLAIELPDDDPRLHGGRNADILQNLTGRLATAEELTACDTKKEGYYRELATGNLLPVQGLLPYLDWLSEAGVQCALVTSAYAANVVFVLAELGLEDRFQVTIGAEDVRRGKPDPEPFLKAAAQIGADPALCLVHEDSPSGVRSGLAAGCTVVALTTTLPASMLEEAGATVCVPDFSSWMAELQAAALHEKSESRRN